LVVLFTVPGVPSVYYGDEQAFRGVKEEREGGDDAVRPAFPADPDGLDPGGWPTYRLHQGLIGLRRRLPWLCTARTEAIEVTNDQFAYEVRGAGGERIRVLLNTADEEYRFEVEGDTEVLVASDDVSGPEHVVGPQGWAILQPAD